MATMYHIETIKPKVELSLLESFLRDEALPYWRSRGFEVRVYVTQHSLGHGPLWLFTGMEAMGDIDGWAQKAMGEAEGERIMAKFMSMIESVQASIVKDIEA
ncbi:MAG: hypothetical protein IPK19_06960 [Chloroflexi bacterium]|nr:hypothetical protein [Chloroflexota bacterium]